MTRALTTPIGKQGKRPVAFLNKALNSGSSGVIRGDRSGWSQSRKCILARLAAVPCLATVLISV